MNLVVRGLLFSKIFALSCIAFMSSANAMVLPCHEDMEMQKANCEACTISLETWSEPLVQPKLLEMTPPLLENVGLSTFTFVFTPASETKALAIRPPPPDLFLWRGEEIFQEQINLRL
jgi:hypothetical protein